MNIGELRMKRIERISSIREAPDDIFITCGSFEDRCLGVPKKLESKLSDRIVLFRFTEPNDKREALIEEMEAMLNVETYNEKYQRIAVEHGKTSEGVLKFHDYCMKNGFLGPKNLFITLDITTFTKGLLLELLFYLKTFLSVERLRLLYTIPKKYAHPEEGELSYGIKATHVLPFYWSEWSPIKDDLLMIILGYEEMRAWALINQFDANLNLLFITRPGSIPEWDSHCEKYNERLLKEVPAIDNIPALDPIETVNVLQKHITDDLGKKYNIFISPMGTKPQTIGVFYFLTTHSTISLNIITTTPIDHNVPYYSWGVGDTFEFFLPLVK